MQTERTRLSVATVSGKLSDVIARGGKPGK